MLVQLRIIGTKEVREFERAFALRILRNPKTVYEVAPDSQFEFIDNELRRIKDKDASGETSKKGTSTRSRKSRK